jgi:hypothetical protein
VKTFVFQKNLNVAKFKICDLESKNNFKKSIPDSSNLNFLADVVPMLSQFELINSRFSSVCLKIRRNSDYKINKKAKFQSLHYSVDIKG